MLVKSSIAAKNKPEICYKSLNTIYKYHINIQ